MERRIFELPGEDGEGLARCFGVMRQLRPHLADAGEFIERVQRQLAQGYHLVGREVGGEVAALAGYRYGENLAWGRFLYVDDLVTDAARRSEGHGEALLDWLIDQGRARGCEQLHLDSGVQRFGAHRFYLRKRLEITSHHFALKL